MQSCKVSVVLIYKLLEACKYIQTHIDDPAVILRQGAKLSRNKLLAMMAHMLHYLLRLLSNYYFKTKLKFYEDYYASSP